MRNLFCTLYERSNPDSLLHPGRYMLCLCCRHAHTHTSGSDSVCVAVCAVLWWFSANRKRADEAIWNLRNACAFPSHSNLNIHPNFIRETIYMVCSQPHTYTRPMWWACRFCVHGVRVCAADV